MRALLVAALAVLCAAPALAQASLFTPTTESRLALTPRQAELLDHVRAEARVLSVVTADVSLLTAQSSVRVDLPDGGSLPLDARSVTVRQPDDYTWRGGAASVTGGIPSSATLVVRKGQITGVIRTGAEVYEIRPLTGGLHAIYQFDLEGRPDHPEDYETFVREEKAHIERERNFQPGVDMRAAPRRTGPLATVQMDVLVVYTAEVTAAVADPAAYAQLAVDASNDSYTNTGMDIELVLAMAYETPTVASDISSDLTALRTFDDGRFDEAHGFREAYGADLVALLGPNTWSGCGLGNVDSTDDRAFTATVYSCSIGNLSFAHEVGHNLGAEHDPPNASNPPAYSYGQGYVNLTGRWRTVMAYNQQCSDGGFNCTRVDYWSDPDVDYPDADAPIDIGPTGNATTQDNSRLLVMRAPTVAAFRARTLGPPASMVSPASLAATLAAGASSTPSFTLSNTAAAGYGPLIWQAKVLNLSPPPGGAPPNACVGTQTFSQVERTLARTATSTTNQFGQSFEALCTGVLNAVIPKIYADAAAGNSWTSTLRLYEGSGTGGEVLASVPFSYTNPSSELFVPITLLTPLEVTSGQTYTWFLEITSGTTAFTFSTANPYLVGEKYETTDGNPSSATASAVEDMEFKLEYGAPSQWAILTTSSGSVDPGASTLPTLTFNTLDLPSGVYTGDLVLTLNDPSQSSVTLPLTMTVSAPDYTFNDGFGWRLLSVPSASATVASLAAQNLVQGVTGSYETFGVNLYTAYDGSAWTPASSTADALPSGRGFAWYLYDTDLDPDPGDPNNSASVALPAALAANGAEPSANVDVSVHGAGFDLLGNPFSDVLDVSGIAGWAGASNLSSNVGQVYQCTPDASPTVACVGSYVTTTALGDLVPVWHALFLETGTAGTLTIPLSAKGAPVVRTSTPRMVAFELAPEAGGAIDRAATLLFRDGATPEWDGWDAEKLAPLSARSVTLAFEGERDGEPALKAQESRPLEPDNFEIPLTVASEGAGADLVLTWPRMEGIPDGWSLTLTDRLTGESVDLRTTTRYAFAVTPSTAREGTQPGETIQHRFASPARFTLSVRSNQSVATGDDEILALALDVPRPNPVTARATVPYTLAEAGSIRLSVFDVLGREVSVLAEGPHPAGRALADWRTDRLAAGLYVLRLETGDAVQTRQVVVTR